MTPDAPDPTTAVAAAPPWWLRVHSALMPDYNRKATIYWWVAALAGAVVILAALMQVLTLDKHAWLQIAAGVTIAMVAGFFPVRIKHSKHAFAAL